MSYFYTLFPMSYSGTWANWNLHCKCSYTAYSVRMWEIQIRKARNTDTFHALLVVHTGAYIQLVGISINCSLHCIYVVSCLNWRLYSARLYAVNLQTSVPVSVSESVVFY